MRAVADSNEELRGVFTVDWNQPAPDGSGRPLIPNEVVHALDKFWLTVQSLCPETERARQWLSANGHRLLVHLEDVVADARTLADRG